MLKKMTKKIKNNDINKEIKDNKKIIQNSKDIEFNIINMNSQK